MEEIYLFTSDRIVLRGILAPVSQPRAVVFIAHGLGEHIGRYGELFSLLNRLSLYCCGIDHRGHGASSGQRGHISNFSEYVRDYIELYEHPAIPRHIPWIQLGHSMGGLIAVHLILAAKARYPGWFKGLVLSAPLLRIAAPVPRWKAAIGEFASRYLPRLSMDNGLNPQLLSHDAKVVEAYIHDPLVHRRVTARWYTEILKAMEDAQTRAGELDLPILLLHGTEDRLTSLDGSEEFIAKVKGQVTFHRLEGYFHEVFQEDAERRATAYSLLFRWLSDLLGFSPVVRRETDSPLSPPHEQPPLS